MHRRHVTAALVVAAVALSGCGTTVPLSSQTALTQPDLGARQGMGASIPAAGSTTAPGSRPGTATTAGPQASATGPQAPGAATGNRAVRGVGQATTAPTGRATGSPVEIGCAYLANGQAFAAPFGAA